MYAFIRGPMVWIAFALFFAGLAFQAWRFFSMTRYKEKTRLPAEKKQEGRKKSAKKKPFLERWINLGDRLLVSSFTWLRTSVAGTHKVMTVVTVVFHILLFVIPIFLLAHNELITQSLGFSLPSLNESLADVLTIIFLLCAFFFLARRIFFKRVRVISSPYDYLMWIVTVAPFLTGFMAFHHWFDYRIMLNVHIVAGEIMLIVVPFTRLSHALFFFLYRFAIGSEHSFGQGSRAW